MLEGAEIVDVDIADSEAVKRALQRVRPDGFVHCAATGMEFPRGHWFELVRFNVDVSLALCEAAASINGCHFVFVGTGLAYRDLGRALDEADPLDTLHPYGASKAAADQLVRAASVEFGLPMTVLRPFSFTGPGDDRTRLFGTLLRAASERLPLALTDCGQSRDHCSATDIARGVVASLLNPPTHASAPQIFNLGSGV
jgi:nucleoside-diphosphate-sugar epimerase